MSQAEGSIEWNTFYLDIEEGVRRVVWELRNAGINTTCSCHHRGYIQCESGDPTTEQNRIFMVMTELGIKEWVAELKVDHLPSDFWHSFWEIRSPSFVQSAKKSKRRRSV